jgi:hypothetical protein
MSDNTQDKPVDDNTLDNDEGRPDQLYRPSSAYTLLDLAPSSFWEGVEKGIIPPADLYLGPRRPRWFGKTLRRCQDRLAALASEKTGAV